MAVKGVRQLIKSAESQGFEVTGGRGGNYRLLSPDKSCPLIFVSATLSVSQALKNSPAHLRRVGFTG